MKLFSHHTKSASRSSEEDPDLDALRQHPSREHEEASEAWPEVLHPAAHAQGGLACVDDGVLREQREVGEEWNACMHARMHAYMHATCSPGKWCGPAASAYLRAAPSLQLPCWIPTKVPSSSRTASPVLRIILRGGPRCRGWQVPPAARSSKRGVGRNPSLIQASPPAAQSFLEQTRADSTAPYPAPLPAPPTSPQAVTLWLKSMGRHLFAGNLNLIAVPMPVSVFEPRSYLVRYVRIRGCLAACLLGAYCPVHKPPAGFVLPRPARPSNE